MRGDAEAVGSTSRCRLPRSQADWLRHLLLALSLVVVALSVVGMHQLSVGHEVASSSGDACPDCGEHQMLFGSCLLVLSLLVLSWVLGPPRLRHLLPFLLPRLSAARLGPVLGRVVPPLSLTELSLRRT